MLKNGPVPASFLNLFSYFQYSRQNVHIKIADDWIRTADLWCRKRPLYQLSHNYCPIPPNVVAVRPSVRVLLLLVNSKSVILSQLLQKEQNLLVEHK